MKNITFIFILLCALPAFANSPPPPNYAPTACTHNEDCIVVEDACPNSWSAINQAFLKEHEDRMNSMRPVIECANGPDPAIKAPTSATCLSDVCTITPTINP
jgi:hypothetical protein